MKVRDIITKLQRRFNADDDILCHLWQVADIVGRANDRDIQISQKIAMDILSDIEDNIDCEYGVNWTVIDTFTNSHIESD